MVVPGRESIARVIAIATSESTVAAASPIQEWEDKDKKFAVQRRSDVLLWDVATGKIREKVQVDEPVTALAFHPTKPILACECQERGRTTRSSGTYSASSARLDRVPPPPMADGDCTCPHGRGDHRRDVRGIVALLDGVGPADAHEQQRDRD